MTSIKDIPYDDILIFLNKNKIDVPDDIDEAYNLVRYLIENKEIIFEPISIIEWIMAYNLLQRKVYIPSYTITQIKLMNSTEIKKLANLLTMKSTNINNIINILYYSGHIISDENDDYENDDYENDDIAFTKIKDVNIRILLDFDDHELNKVCQTNKSINKLCNDDYFWKFKLDKLVSMDLFPTDLRNKGKEIYNIFKKYFDERDRLALKYFKNYDEFKHKLEKFKYIANWVTINNYPSVLNLLIELKYYPDQSAINIAAFKGNIEVLDILGDYIKKKSPSNHPAMLKYLSKGIFPNVQGANLANLNKQYEILDLLKEFNIYPEHNYIDLKGNINYELAIKDDVLLDLLKDVNIFPTLPEKVKNMISR